jgi:hypothetical protein
VAITLAITDTGDGTGGTATVAGSNVASTNTLYRATWDGQTGANTWTSVGSRTGDGTIGISTAAGFYLFRLDNLLSGVTTVVTNYQPLTDSTTQAILYRIMQAISTRITALTLTGATIKVRWLPRHQVGDGTVIVICPVNSENFPGTLTSTDDIGIPVAVVLMDPNNQDLSLNLNRNLLWRQRILSALRWQRLAGVSEVMYLAPEPATILNPGVLDGSSLAFSPLFFRAMTRTTRG